MPPVSQPAASVPLSRIASEVDALSNADLLADQRRDWQRGGRLPAEASRQLWPRRQHDEELLLDLIWAEVLLRAELGEDLTLEEDPNVSPRWPTRCAASSTSTPPWPAPS
jgi:hypothetical protein